MKAGDHVAQVHRSWGRGVCVCGYGTWKREGVGHTVWVGRMIGVERKSWRQLDASTACYFAPTELLPSLAWPPAPPHTHTHPPPSTTLPPPTQHTTQVRHLVLSPGLSYSCLRGMVSSHVAAGLMDFSRFERHIAKVDPKELLPQVCDWVCLNV